MGPTLKAFLAKIAPEDLQARATRLQDAVGRISCVLQIHNARIIAKCNGSISTLVCPAPLGPAGPCSWLPCSVTCVFSPGDVSARSGPPWRGIPGALAPLLDSIPVSLKSSNDDVLWSLAWPQMCGAAAAQVYVTDAGRVHVAMFGDAGEVTEVSHCNVLNCAQVFPFWVLACRQPRLPTSFSKRQLA